MKKYQNSYIHAFINKILLFMLFIFLLIPNTSKASSALEKKIRKLEIEVIKFEKSRIAAQNKKNGYVPKGGTAHIRSKKTSKPKKVVAKSKELNMELPEYDSKKKCIAVKSDPSNDAIAEDGTIKVNIDSNLLGSSHSGKIFLKDDGKGGGINTESPTISGAELLKVDKDGNLVISNRNGVKSIDKDIINEIQIQNIADSIESLSKASDKGTTSSKPVEAGSIVETKEESETNGDKKDKTQADHNQNINVKMEMIDIVNKTSDTI